MRQKKTAVFLTHFDRNQSFLAVFVLILRDVFEGNYEVKAQYFDYLKYFLRNMFRGPKHCKTDEVRQKKLPISPEQNQFFLTQLCIL